MNKGSIGGIIVTGVGLFLIGVSIGRNSKGEATSAGLTIAGLLLVFIGYFVVVRFKEKKPK